MAVASSGGCDNNQACKWPQGIRFDDLQYTWKSESTCWYKTNKAGASSDVAGITIKWPPGIRFDDLHRCRRSSNYTLAFVRNCTQQYIQYCYGNNIHWRSTVKNVKQIFGYGRNVLNYPIDFFRSIIAWINGNQQNALTHLNRDCIVWKGNILRLSILYCIALL